jgi:hypothetical protein
MNNIVKKQYITAIAVVLGIGISGCAFAFIASNQLSACVSKDGEMRLIVSGFTKKQKCEKNEQLVSWNVAGQQGPQGVAGPVGPKGDKGDTGVTGLAGLQGQQGTQGEVGPMGPQGLQGIQGTKGDKGDTGVPGQTLHLLDANNQDLGVFVDLINPDSSNREFHTYLPALGAVARFYSDADHRIAKFVYSGLPGGEVWYTGSACTGTPSSAYSFLENYTLTAVTLVPGGNKYFIGTNDIGTTRTWNSHLTDSGCKEISPETHVTYALQEVTPSFVEPIVWPLKLVQQ